MNSKSIHFSTVDVMANEDESRKIAEVDGLLDGTKSKLAPIYLSSLNVNMENMAERLASTNIHTNFMMNKKAIKTIGILLFGFYACWSPILVYFVCFASEPSTPYENVTIYALMFVVACNSIVNPIVYALRDKSILRRRRSSAAAKRAHNTSTRATNSEIYANV
jgi:hypothetical protein